MTLKEALEAAEKLKQFLKEKSETDGQLAKFRDDVEIIEDYLENFYKEEEPEEKAN